MDDWVWGYLAGRKKERRRLARAMAVERYTMEQGLRAQYGMPPLPMQAHPGYLAPGKPLLTWRGVRRAALVLAVLAVLLLVAFAVYAIGYGVQHGLIYPARSR